MDAKELSSAVIREGFVHAVPLHVVVQLVGNVRAVLAINKSYAVATQYQADVAVHTALVLYCNTTANGVEITVVVGRVTVLDTNEAHHVIARAVPLSLNMISIISHSTGVPERLVVIDVIACARPTISNISPLSVLIVGVALCVVATALFCTLLFVSVFVELMVGMATLHIVAPVVKSGEVPNTKAPDPVSPVTAAARLALDGVARKVATPDHGVIPAQVVRSAS